MNQRIKNSRIIKALRRNSLAAIVVAILILVLLISLIYTCTHVSRIAGLNAPSDLIGTVKSATEIELSWQDNSENETAFEVERKKGEIGTWTQIARVGPNIIRYSDINVIPNTLYAYRVRAFKDKKASSYSNEYSTTTPIPTITERYPMGIAVTGTRERVSVVTAKQMEKWGDPNPHLPQPTSVTEKYHAPPGTLFVAVTVVINNLSDQGFNITTVDFTLKDTASGGIYNWYAYPEFDAYPNDYILAPLQSLTGQVFYLIPVSASGRAMEVTHILDNRIIAWELQF